MRLTDFFSESANGGNDTFSAFDTVTVVLKGGRRFNAGPFTDTGGAGRRKTAAEALAD
jgi:hypothetical protein